MRTIIVGFDSFDPGVFESLQEAGKTPNLSKFVEGGGYSRLEVCSPPQTEVSWTSIATGVDPGSHGIFDFVHRDPLTYMPYVSLLPTKQTVLGEQFMPPYTTKTLFHEAADMGSSDRDLAPNTSHWLRTRRRRRVPVIALTQRPRNVARLFFSEAQHIALFRLEDHDDRRRMGELMGPGVIPEPLPADFSFWYRGPACPLVHVRPLSLGR